MSSLQHQTLAVKAFILSEFTKELLRHSISYDISTLEKILREKTKDVVQSREKEKIENQKKFYQIVTQKKLLEIEKPQIEKPERTFSLSKPENVSISNSPSIYSPQKSPPIQKVNIPYYPLPRELQSYQPTPSAEPIDIGELTDYLKDPTVSSIECNGSDTLVTVKRGKQLRNTNVKLSKNQIDDIINAFSRASKIPVNQGVFRVTTGGVIMSAVVSEVGSKFVITKLF